MRYRAEQNGFVDSHYVCEGEEFDFDGAAPSWATPIGEPKSKAVVAPKKRSAAKAKTK